jgi:uncharacterized protein (DUF1800 family)
MADSANTIDPGWAWDVYSPTSQAPWDVKKAGHLFRRGGFGATAEELEAAVQLGPQKTIDNLLKGGAGQEEFDTQTTPLAQSAAQANNGQQLRAWWLYRMMYSPHPLREKLTLFWHNHFATSNAKVNNAGFMLGQYQLMQRQALGNYRTLIMDMAGDPAMMVWLDTRGSKKAAPNENYARELLELFSLGVGNYTETDIREAARAFSGWDIQAGKAVFNENQHDGTDKTFLGQKGNWKGADITRICLEQKVCARFICRKLYRFLVSESLPAAAELIEPLADQFRKSDYDFGALVKTMLRSNLFFSAQAYRSSIKSPVDFALGIARALEGRVGTVALAQALESLGQAIFYPPSVKGWDGGQAWLNGQTLLFRQNLALAMTSTEDGRFGRRTDPAALARKYSKKTDDELVDFFLRLFLQGDVPAESRSKLTDYLKQARQRSVPVYWTAEDATDQRVRAVCHLVLTLPEFQLQ